LGGGKRFYDEVELLATEEGEEAEQGTLKEYGVTHEEDVTSS
jgi:hypothetical protein